MPDFLKFWRALNLELARRSPGREITYGTARYLYDRESARAPFWYRDLKRVINRCLADLNRWDG